MASTTTIHLNNGAQMPVLGLGTWKSKPGEVKAAVEAAIDVGYRHIDCAFLYDNEEEIGDALQCKIGEGKVKREDLFITTKLWPTYYRSVRECFEISLRQLKLKYVDLYLLHWPFALQYTKPGDFFPNNKDGQIMVDEGIHYLEVYKEVEKLHKEGLVKAIGVSNFNEYQLNRVVKEMEIKPSVHQFEMHPYLDQEKLLQFCKSKNIAVTGFSPFGSLDRPWAKPGEPTLFDDPKLQTIAKKHGKSVAQVILRYILQRGVVVIPKSTTRNHIIGNSEIFDFNLSDKDRAVIKTIDRNWRALECPMFSAHKYYPYRENYSE